MYNLELEILPAFLLHCPSDEASFLIISNAEGHKLFQKWFRGGNIGRT